jgi:hypothetical protein
LGGLASPRLDFLPRTKIRPLVNDTSSRNCVITSQPASTIAGVMNLVQMSRSLKDFLSASDMPIWLDYRILKAAAGKTKF